MSECVDPRLRHSRTSGDAGAKYILASNHIFCYYVGRRVEECVCEEYLGNPGQ